MKSQKLVLDTSAMQEDFFEETAMIGIASSLPSHRFVWMLNTRFALDFHRDPEMDVRLKLKTETDLQYFSVFHFACGVSGAQHFLYRLRNENQTLLPEIKRLDYLWMVQNAASEETALLYMEHLRAMPEVQLANMVASEDLKNRAHLLV